MNGSALVGRRDDPFHSARLVVVPRQVVEMVRASGLRTVEELSEEALRMHPRAKLTVAGRRLLVQRILAQGWPVARAAEAQGVSVATAYKWLGRWRIEGDTGLADRSCRPHTSPVGCRPSRNRPSWPGERPTESDHTGSAGRLGRLRPRCMPSWPVTTCPGGGSWTAPPAWWCATSASGQVSWSMSTSSPRGGSLLGWAPAAGPRPRRRQPGPPPRPGL
jgi:leucine-zipper of insertion element IS481